MNGERLPSEPRAVRAIGPREEGLSAVVRSASPGSRRQRLIDRFDAVAPRVLSLDVFDTLLTRAFEHPTHVFVEVHRALVASGEQLVGVDAATFARLRVDAESTARGSRPGGEVTLEEIAVELSRALGGRPAPASLVTAEVAMERAFIQLDPDVAALVLHASARGVPYVLVSDMYLGSDHLLELLRAAVAPAGLELPPPARVFVSSERRTNKGARLFPELLAELGCPPAEVLHVGDNAQSDVESARRNGIHAEHAFRESPWLAAIFEAEARQLAAQAMAPRKRPYDLGLRTARLAAVLSEMATPAARPDHFHYGALVLGPLLTQFAEWVVDDCVRHGQRRVYCLMREGHLLAPLIARAAEAVGARLDVRRLWASRYAIRAASFQAVTEPELRGYLLKRRSYPLDVVARDLGLDLEGLRAETGVRHTAPLLPGDLARVVDGVLGSPALRAQLLETSAARRGRLFEYLRSVGVLQEENLTLVDLGWGGTIQHRLASVLADEPLPRRIRGLYFATESRLLQLPSASCSADSFLFHLGEPAETWWPVRRTPELLELACMPRQGSFRGIDEDGVPSTFDQVLPERQLEEIEEVQRGILRFAELWLPGAPRRRAGLTHADRHGELARLRAILVRSLTEPTLEEVRLFEDWEHDANDGALDHENLLGDASMRERARFMSYWHIMDLDSHHTFWPAGLARLHGKSAESGSALAKSALRYARVRRSADLFARAAAVLARRLRK